LDDASGPNIKSLGHEAVKILILSVGRRYFLPLVRLSSGRFDKAGQEIVIAALLRLPPAVWVYFPKVREMTMDCQIAGK
jgi:hypothetical protein